MSACANRPRLLSWSCSVLVTGLALMSCRKGCHEDEAWKQQLFTEVRVGNLPSVDALLSAENCPNVVNKIGQTPLMIAATNGRYDVANRLLKYGVKVDAKDGNGYTALMFASEACDPRLVRLLVDAGAYVPMRNFAKKETSFDLAKQRADFWSQHGGDSGVSRDIEVRWELSHPGESSPLPKAACSEVSGLLGKHAAGG